MEYQDALVFYANISRCLHRLSEISQQSFFKDLTYCIRFTAAHYKIPGHGDLKEAVMNPTNGKPLNEQGQEQRHKMETDTADDVDDETKHREKRGP